MVILPLIHSFISLTGQTHYSSSSPKHQSENWNQNCCLQKLISSHKTHKDTEGPESMLSSIALPLVWKAALPGSLLAQLSAFSFALLPWLSICTTIFCNVWHITYSRSCKDTRHISLGSSSRMCLFLLSIALCVGVMNKLTLLVPFL